MLQRQSQARSNESRRDALEAAVDLGMSQVGHNQELSGAMSHRSNESWRDSLKAAVDLGMSQVSHDQELQGGVGTDRGRGQEGGL